MRKTVDLIEKLNDNEVALYLDECVSCTLRTEKRMLKDTQSAR